jgi:hypothetical protein
MLIANEMQCHHLVVGKNEGLVRSEFGSQYVCRITINPRPSVKTAVFSAWMKVRRSATWESSQEFG